MKKIYFDFETTSPNPAEADILEASFIFVEGRDVIEVFSSKIFIKKHYSEMSYLEIDTLKFNGINSEKEFYDHNSKSQNWESFISKVVTYYVEMFSDWDEINDMQKLPLTGWNNAGFDNLILQRNLSDYNNYFDYHTRDIMHRFQILKECEMLKGLSLSKVHKEIIGTEDPKNFHNSDVDCYAVKDLDEWYEDRILPQIKGGAQ